ncbi:MAG: hypothetical protein NUW21_02855 [Elusimicrobia bacterium]|nr:hypothetical protein [Elusimicrobiota bacterium]
MSLLLAAALALSASARAAPAFATLEKVRGWPVYDGRVSGETDLGDLCRMARLPCGVVAAKGERLRAPAGPIAGLTVGELLDRVLAAHPGYAAEMSEGVLFVRRPKDACAAALERPAAPERYPIRSARVASWLVLRAAGWPAAADAGLASLTGDAEDARYLRVDLIVHEGASVRRTLDAIARGDGRMLWAAESDGKACAGFRFENRRRPQAIEKGSVLVSVSGHESVTPRR